MENVYLLVIAHLFTCSSLLICLLARHWFSVPALVSQLHRNIELMWH